MSGWAGRICLLIKARHGGEGTGHSLASEVERITLKIGPPWPDDATLATVLVGLPLAEPDGKRVVGAEASAALVFASEDRAGIPEFGARH